MASVDPVIDSGHLEHDVPRSLYFIAVGTCVGVRRGLGIAVLGLAVSACSLDSLQWPNLNGPAQEAGQADNGSRTASRSDVEVEATAEQIRQVQYQLFALGHKPGPIDGILGPRTESAIKAYKAEVGLTADERITEGLIEHLADEQRELALAGDLPDMPAAPALARTSKQASASDKPWLSGGDLPLPQYAPGSRYVYANGEVLTLRSIKDDKVRWRSNRGVSVTAHRNFLVPPLAWSKLGEEGQRKLTSNPQNLWPLAAGHSSEILAVSTTRFGGRPGAPIEQREIWVCRNEGQESVEVPAGRFATTKFVCLLDRGADQENLERTWYYAPEPGQVVLHEERKGEATDSQRWALIAVQPEGKDWPPAASAGLGWALQHALETLPDGEDTAWQSSGVTTKVTIKAGEHFENAVGQSCRRFQQIWLEGDTTAAFPGSACRNDVGQWHIPGLETTDKIAESRP